MRSSDFPFLAGDKLPCLKDCCGGGSVGCLRVISQHRVNDSAGDLC